MSIEREDIKKEIREISALLDKLDAWNPFQVPENYFEHLPQEIQKRKDVSEKPAEVWLGLFPREMIRIAFVSMIFFFAVLTGIFLVNRQDNQVMFTQENEFYFEEYWVWYSDYLQLDFYELIAENGFHPNEVLVSEELVIDYLIDYAYYYQLSLDELDEE